MPFNRIRNIEIGTLIAIQIGWARMYLPPIRRWRAKPWHCKSLAARTAPHVTL